MAESMVERVAKAIAKSYDTECGELGLTMEPATSTYLARAAIAAMREPTEEMVNEAMALGTDYEIEPGVPVTWPPAGKTLWQAMIDAALSLTTDSVEAGHVERSEHP